MAYAPDNIEYETIDGLFTEKEFGKLFEYTKNPAVFTHWDFLVGATHRVFIGGLGETRPIRVLKTVAYVMTENEGVWEKWQIKHNWTRT